MFSREWDALYGFIKVLIAAAIIIGLAVHFGLDGLGRATQGANVAVTTIKAAMLHLSQSIQP